MGGVIMSLKTKVLIVRTIMVVLALVIIAYQIATFGNGTDKWVFPGLLTCVILAVIHNSLMKK
jgi:hypothetical protein